MPTKEIPNPEIGKVDCPCCGTVIPLRINMNGCAYLYCRGTFDNDRCFYRVSFGKTYTRKLIRDYCDNEAISKTGTEANIDTDDRGMGNANGGAGEREGFFSRITRAIAE